MTVKEYLEQVFYIDIRIKSKLEQIETLNELVTKINKTYSDMSKNPNGNINQLPETVIKIVDMKNKVNEEIKTLLELRREISKLIQSLENREEQIVLEKRYLCFDKWEKIALDMNYSIQYCFKVHKRALNKISKSLKIV